MVTQPASLRLVICRYIVRFWTNRLATNLLLLLCTFVCSFSRTSTAHPDLGPDRVANFAAPDFDDLWGVALNDIVLVAP